MRTDKKTITVDEAFSWINNGDTVRNCDICGTMQFEASDFEKTVVLENCTIENLKAISVQFNKPVKFLNCHFKNCCFIFCYFPRGLEIESCLFDEYLDFQCGGHNEPSTKFSISNTIFKAFVNFFDCIYEGPVIITRNKFEKGTNLLGNQNQPYVASFDNTVVIEGNIGELDIDGEGGPEEVPEPNIFPIHPN